MATKTTPEYIERARNAMRLLPGIYQAIGKLGAALRRCKPGSVKCEDYGRRLDKLNSQAAELGSAVSMALHFAEAETRKITPKLETLILRAVKTFGSYDPDKIMVLFEEDLDDQEYSITSMFLRWTHVNGKTFGRGNIHEVFAECEAAIGTL